MVAQRGLSRPVNYRVFRKCLEQVAWKAHQIRASVHIQFMDSSITDSWRDIQKLIENYVCKSGIDVFIYKKDSKGDAPMFRKVIQPPLPRFELVDFRLN
jgi:hypothetical protein